MGVTSACNSTWLNGSVESYNATGEEHSCTETESSFMTAPIATSTILMVITYGIICIIGMIGNCLVIFVFIRYTKMKTVTNMYILNLSIADGIFLLGLPMVMTTSILRSWVYGAILCKVYYISTGVNMFTGALTLTVMSADRYLAVCHPISSMRYRTPRYAIVAITLIWLVSFLLITPIILYAQIMQSPYSASRQSCQMLWPDGQKAYISYTMLLGFVIPVVLICIFYALLLIRLRTTGPTCRSKEKKRSHRKVTKLVTLIIAIYIVCWLPYWAFQVHLIVPKEVYLMPWQILVFQVCTILSYANSMVNPCLYAFTNENFRETFISAFRCVPDPILSVRRGSEYSVAATKATGVGNQKIVMSGSGVNSVNGKSKRKLPSLFKTSRKNKKAHNEYEFTTLNNGDNNGNNAINHEVDVMPCQENGNAV